MENGLNVISTDKGHVVEHVLNIEQSVLGGTTLVLLEMKELGERRYRLRTSEGAEARVTCAPHRHIQETRNHRVRGVYQVDKGWIACITNVDGVERVDMAFANDDNFILSVTKNTDYVIVMSGPIVYSYMTNDKKASKPKKDELYTFALALSDGGIFQRYALEHGTELEDVQKMVEKSFEQFSA